MTAGATAALLDGYPVLKKNRPELEPADKPEKN